MHETRLNKLANLVCKDVEDNARRLRVQSSYVVDYDDRAQVIDFGVQCAGGLNAGIKLAEICTAGLAEIKLANFVHPDWPGMGVQFSTDHPLIACMACQYAGLQVDSGNFHAMCSGPIRAVLNQEPVLQHYGLQEAAERVVCVLESSRLPDRVELQFLSDKLPAMVREFVLCVAPTSSVAGMIQIVARSVETAMHKLFELGFDLRKIISGFGVAPLPAPGKNDMQAMGRSNDAILFGGIVELFVECEDSEIEQIGPNVPSNSSTQFGEPFAKIFAEFDHDFYKVDPNLFAPAQVTFTNLTSGNQFRFGETRFDILNMSLEP